MFGSSSNILNIYIRAGGIDTLIWTKAGNQVNDWLNGVAYLPTCASEFNIIVEGVRRSSFSGFIAVDQIVFDRCYEAPAPSVCPSIPDDPNPFVCRNRYCVARASTCDYEPDCCDGSDEDDYICYAHKR